MNKPPKYMLDPFDHQLPVPFHPQMVQNDFLSLWLFYTIVLNTAQQSIEDCIIMDNCRNLRLTFNTFIHTDRGERWLCFENGYSNTSRQLL